MNRAILWPALLLLTMPVVGVYGQTKIGEMESSIKFQKKGDAFAYFNEKQRTYTVNLQNFTEINRSLYDSNYQLISNYAVPARTITLDRDNYLVPPILREVYLEDGIFEVYTGGDGHTNIVLPDFTRKKDSIVFALEPKDHFKDEKQVSAHIYSKGVRMLCFSDDRNELYVYQWRGPGKTDTFTFRLPESTLSAEEVKQYTKEARVKYKRAFETVVAGPVNEIALLAASYPNKVWSDENKIRILCQMPYSVGYHLVEIDMQQLTLSTHNFFVNDMRANAADARFDTKRYPFAIIYNNTLIIRNSSYYYFEYLFYDLHTREKVRSYSSGPDEKLRTVLNSDFIQRGTWAFASDEKKVENEKAFLRKLISGAPILVISEETADSITITTGSMKDIVSLGGMILGVTTFQLGYAANIMVGNVQIIPYLLAGRQKLSYCHSRFSKTTFDISPSNNVITTLDTIANNMDEKEKKLKRYAFIVKKDQQLIGAVFNKDSGKFDLYLRKDD